MDDSVRSTGGSAPPAAAAATPTSRGGRGLRGAPAGGAHPTASAPTCSIGWGELTPASATASVHTGREGGVGGWYRQEAVAVEMTAAPGVAVVAVVAVATTTPRTTRAAAAAAARWPPPRRGTPRARRVKKTCPPPTGCVWCVVAPAAPTRSGGSGSGRRPRAPPRLVGGGGGGVGVPRGTGRRGTRPRDAVGRGRGHGAVRSRRRSAAGGGGEGLACAHPTGADGRSLQGGRASHKRWPPAWPPAGRAAYTRSAGVRDGPPPSPAWPHSLWAEARKIRAPQRAACAPQRSLDVNSGGRVPAGGAGRSPHGRRRSLAKRRPAAAPPACH